MGTQKQISELRKKNGVSHEKLAELACFDSSVEYNVPEVKRCLAGLSYFIRIITIFSAALMALPLTIIGGGEEAPFFGKAFIVLNLLALAALVLMAII